MSPERDELNIMSSSEFLHKVEGQLRNFDGGKMDGLNDDWKQGGIKLTGLNLLCNIFIEVGLASKEKVNTYLAERIYGPDFLSTNFTKDLNEMQMVLDLGYSEIKDFGKRLSEQLERHASGQLYPNGTPHNKV